jgi:S1-C subfamily serine protease
VLGTACGLGVEGSGWVAADGVVVTNAHVVAGQNDTTVLVEGKGAHHPATVIWFDEKNDVALLHVPEIEGKVKPLPMDAGAKVGTSAAILGFPHNGPYNVEPARLGDTTTVKSDDAYGNGPILRKVTSLRGLVRSGNSGGPLVDTSGDVVGTIFASTLGGTARSGLAVPDTIVQNALQSAHGQVQNGPCAR